MLITVGRVHRRTPLPVDFLRAKTDCLVLRQCFRCVRITRVTNSDVTDMGLVTDCDTARELFVPLIVQTGVDGRFFAGHDLLSGFGSTTTPALARQTQGRIGVFCCAGEAFHLCCRASTVCVALLCSGLDRCAFLTERNFLSARRALHACLTLSRSRFCHYGRLRLFHPAVRRLASAMGTPVGVRRPLRGLVVWVVGTRLLNGRSDCFLIGFALNGVPSSDDFPASVAAGLLRWLPAVRSSIRLTENFRWFRLGIVIA